VRETPAANERELAAYLRSRACVAVAAGLARDVLGPANGIIGTLAILTDGVYAWPSDLAYYVEKHHLELPSEFVAHVAKRSRT
jgi:hypothetical protein